MIGWQKCMYINFNLVSMLLGTCKIFCKIHLSPSQMVPVRFNHTYFNNKLSLSIAKHQLLVRCNIVISKYKAPLTLKLFSILDYS